MSWRLRLSYRFDAGKRRKVYKILNCKQRKSALVLRLCMFQNQKNDNF